MTIHFFDFDNTLFDTNAAIHVTKDEKIVHKDVCMNEYQLKDGETFYFEEFRCGKFLRANAKPIQPMIDLMKSLTISHKVIILTARSRPPDTKDFYKFLREHGIEAGGDRRSLIKVEFAGELKHLPTPLAKRKIAQKHLQLWSYAEVDDGYLYDDSIANLQEFRKITFCPTFTFHVLSGQNGAMRPFFG